MGSLLSQYVRRTPLHRGKLRVTRLAFRLLPRVPVRGRFGNKMLSVPDNTTVRSIVGTYTAVLDCVDRLRPGMAFIDVGANAGVFSLFAADRVGEEGRVVAFEPSLEIFQLFLRNVSLNSNARRIVPFNAALGEETRVVRFDPATPEHSGRAHVDASGSAEVLQIGPAELTPLLTALIEGRETIVKIDVEGAEVMVLAALAPFLRSGRVAALVAEVNAVHLARFGSTEAELFGMMAELGFTAAERSDASAHYDQIFLRAEAG